MAQTEREFQAEAMRFFTQLEECHHRPPDLPRTAGVGQFKRPCDLLWFPLLQVRITAPLDLPGAFGGWQEWGRPLVALEWKSAGTPTEYDSEQAGGRLKDHQADFLRAADCGQHGRGWLVVNFRGHVCQQGDQEWTAAGLPCSSHPLVITETLAIDRTFAIRMRHWDNAMAALPARPIRGRAETRRPLVNPNFLAHACALEIFPMLLSGKKDGKTWDFGTLAPKAEHP